MDDFYANLGKKVKELRIENGLTQNEVAKALNISQVQVSRLEKKILLRMRDRLVSLKSN